MRTPRIHIGSPARIAAGLVAVVLALAPTMARAQTTTRAATLQRSLTNITQGPVDIMLTPATTVRTLWVNGKAAGYNVPENAALELFGSMWMIPLNAAAGLFRIGAGVLEFPIGLGLLVSKSFTDKEPPSLYEIERTPALIEYKDDVWPAKLGPYYVETAG